MFLIKKLGEKLKRSGLNDHNSSVRLIHEIIFFSTCATINLIVMGSRLGDGIKSAESVYSFNDRTSCVSNFITYYIIDWRRCNRIDVSARVATAEPR
jgi:hypothetical protein